MVSLSRDELRAIRVQLETAERREFGQAVATAQARVDALVKQAAQSGGTVYIERSIGWAERACRDQLAAITESLWWALGAAGIDSVGWHLFSTAGMGDLAGYAQLVADAEAEAEDDGGAPWPIFVDERKLGGFCVPPAGGFPPQVWIRVGAGVRIEDVPYVVGHETGHARDYLTVSGAGVVNRETAEQSADRFAHQIVAELRSGAARRLLHAAVEAENGRTAWR